MTQLSESEFYRILDVMLPNSSNDSDKETSRLYFKRISLEHLDDMHSYSIDKRLYEYFEYPAFTKKADTKRYLQNLIQLEGSDVLGRKALSWFVFRKVDQKLIGTVRLMNIDYHRQSAEWGYGIDPNLWGDGYILEIQHKIMSYVFGELRLNRLWGRTRIDNNRAKASLLSVGAKEEGVFRQAMRDYNGNYFDVWRYSFLLEDYLHAIKFKNEYSSVISREEITTIISKSLEGVQVTSEDDMNSVSNWDSLSHIIIIRAIEKSVGYSFTPQEIAQSTSVESIYNTVNR